MTGRRVRRGLAAGVGAALVVGCSPAAPSGPAVQAWPEPWADRPVVELSYDMAPDLSTAAGTETVVFVPDREVCELVFRNWPNKPTAAVTGTALRIDAAVVDGTAVTPREEAAGAPEGAPGTLVELPLPACVPAGTQVVAELAFTLVLGPDASERVGYSPSDGIAWLGTAFPLLAWVRGSGWARDPAVDLFGETVTSEDFRLASLSVTADADQQVLGTGREDGTGSPAPGRTTHRFTADAVRDVAVSVGGFDVVTRRAGDVVVHVGTPRSGSRASGDEWADELVTGLERLGERFGHYPYTDLWATIVPAQTDGVEFPSALQFADQRRSEIQALAAHELAHQWFYALVGNDQAVDPWLDEALATYGQAVIAGEEDRYRLDDVPRSLDGLLGRPMSYWASFRTGSGKYSGFDRYVRGVYDQGAAALLAGRDRVGAERFDTAVRRYLVENAHGVATPGDLAAAFRDVPEALEVLDEQGAFG